MTQPVTSYSGSSTLKFKKPPVGTNHHLSVSEIRWCFREHIRLETMKDLVSLETFIKEYNRLVTEYNLRCVNFWYREGTLNRARRDVEGMRSQIVAEAISTVERFAQ